MNKQEKEKIIEMVSANGGCGAEDDWAKGFDDGVNACLDTIESIETEEVELPSAVIKHLEKYKPKWSLSKALTTFEAPSEVFHWLHHVPNYKENQETFAKAWLYGYKVKEKLYIMPVPYAKSEEYYFQYKTIMRVTTIKETATKFTESEINKYFPKIAEFKEEVAE